VRLALVRSGAPLARGAWVHRGRTIVHVTAAGDRAGAAAGPWWRVGPRPLTGVGIAFEIAGCSGQLLDGGAARAAA